jgi:hypothetical protein
MKHLYLAAIGVLTTTLAFAQGSMPPQPPSAAAASAAAATGGSTARITKEQLQATMPPLAAHFDEIDTTHQGYVTPQQIQQYMSNHSPQMPSPPQFPQ